MVGIIVVTHGIFGKELIHSLELIIGKQGGVEALTLVEGDDVQQLKKEVKRKTEELDQGDGVLVLVDLMGGSPWNVSSVHIQSEQVECLSGINMPMLLEAVEGRATSGLQQLKEACIRAAKEGVISARELYMSGNSAEEE